MTSIDKILVAIDGSKNAQIAADYAFWLGSKLNADLVAQHVVDPRLVRLFIDPEFAEELGMTASIETSEKVLAALRKIGTLILSRFHSEAHRRGFDTGSKLSEGRVVEEILENAKNFDLLIVGHRDHNDIKTATNLAIGSVAEGIVSAASGPVLIAIQPLDEIEKVIVAYDGSDAASGALVMAEELAKNIDAKLEAVVVTNSFEDEQNAKRVVKKGEALLREYWSEDVFSTKSGLASNHLLDDASGTQNSLLVVGAYGYRDPNETVLGSTTLRVIRETRRSVLIYRPSVKTSTPAEVLPFKVQLR